MTLPSRQSGVGLIEVLVAFAVFAIAVLGTFKMQIIAKQTNYHAAQYSAANELARDLLTRIRSNRSEISTYAVEEVGGLDAPFDADCAAVPCSARQMAAYDLSEWITLLRGAAELVTIDGHESLAGGLVFPRACIRNNSGEVSVILNWRGIDGLVSDVESDCGKDSGLYGTGNSYRRQLVMTTYIGPW